MRLGHGTASVNLTFGVVRFGILPLFQRREQVSTVKVNMGSQGTKLKRLSKV